MLLDSWAIPYLHLGPVPYKTFTVLAYRLKSISIVRRYTIDGIADPSALGGISLWHSAVFKSSRHLSCYCSSFTKKGVLRVKDLYDPQGNLHRHLASKLGLTWRVVYEQALVTFKQTPVTDW